MTNIRFMIPHLLYPSLFLMHCSVIGFAVNHFFKIWKCPIDIKDNHYLRWFFAMSSGMMFTVTILFVLGMTGCFYQSTVLWSGAISFLLSIFILFRMDYHHSFKDISQIRLKNY